MRSTTQSAKDPQKANETPENERQSTVTPLFAAQVSARRPTVVRFGSISTAKRALAVVGSLVLVASAAWFWQQTRTQERATERLALGCLDVADCRAVVQNIETLQDSCLFNCSHLATLAQQARTEFRVVLEQQAQAEQSNQDKAYQSAIQSRRTAEEEHSKLSQAARLAEREHELRLELERLAAPTERLRAVQSSAEGAQLAYFKQLSPEQQLNRLSACQKRGTSSKIWSNNFAQAAPSLAGATRFQPRPRTVRHDRTQRTYRRARDRPR